MRVLPINCHNYQSNTNCRKLSGNHYQQNPQTVTANPNFKGNSAVAAGLFGAILGGAALLFAAPVAVIAGAAVVGALGGAGMAEDDNSLDEVERYKYTHEY